MKEGQKFARTFNYIAYIICMGPGVAYWLRRGATSRMVPGSIPGGVTGFFSDIFPSDRTMALGVDSDPSENEYQEHSWELKAAGA